MDLYVEPASEDRCEGRDVCALCGSVLEEQDGQDFEGVTHAIRVCPDRDCGWVCLEGVDAASPRAGGG